MSAGLFLCPSCNATLRVPPGAASVRCPQCKSVLQIEAPPAPAAAPPLPFGRKKPPPAKPPAMPPVAAKAPPGTPAGPMRASLVDEEAEEAEGRARAAAERKALAREALREQVEADDERAEEFAFLSEVCQHGRTALTAMMYGLYGYAAAMALVVAGVAGLLFAPEMGPTGLIVSLVLSQLANVAIGVGFVFAVLGPPQGRFIGIAGVTAVVVQVALTVAALVKVMPQLMDYHGQITNYGEALLAFHGLGLGSYVPMLAETPARLIQGYERSFMGIAIGAVEFTRLVLVCQLTQIYADNGKEPEVGHKSFASVSLFFWVIMLGAMFRMAVSFGFDWAPRGELMFTLGSVSHALVTALILLVGAVAVLGQAQVMQATVEFVTAERYILKGERLVE